MVSGLDDYEATYNGPWHISAYQMTFINLIFD